MNNFLLKKARREGKTCDTTISLTLLLAINTKHKRELHVGIEDL
jgi:hypothetical protein